MSDAFHQIPDDGTDIDREIRIEKMKRELDELAAGAVFSGEFGEVPPALEEAFLANVLAFENAPLDTNFNRLMQLGVRMEPPAELDDAVLAVRLREVLRALANIRCFISDTDHLNDRELYEWLWSKGLREETPDLTQLEGAWHTSPIGAGTDEDTAIYLRYYAGDGERQRWQASFPKDPLPPCEARPYDRDRNLPRATS